MECFLAFGVLVVVVIVLVAFASKAQARADNWNKSYQALAQRYGGVCLPAGWLSHPSVRFQYGATSVLLNTYNAGGGGQFTQMHINWPDSRLRLEVFPQRQFANTRTFRGMHEMDSGDADFDKTYTIRANHEDTALIFLSDGVRWQIDRLRHLLGIPDAYFAIHRGRILIKKPTYIRRFAELEEFTQLSLELYDQAMLTRMVGISFVEDETVQVISAATCQICGDDITTDMIFCRRCKTPHHMDCWQYYGCCAVYGCQEQRFVVPKLAGPAGDS